MPGILNPFRFGAGAPPTLERAQGSVTVLATDTVGTTIKLTTTFPGKVLFVFGAGAGSLNSSANGSAIRSFGFATSASNRRAVCAYSRHNINPSNDRAETRDDAVMLFSADGFGSGIIDVQSFDSDGATLVITEQLAANGTFSWVILGGSKLTNYNIVTVQEPASTGNQAITGVGFQGDQAFFLAAGGLTSVPSEGAHSIASYGFANATSSAVLGQGGKDLTSPSVQRSYNRHGECVALMNTAITALDGIASLVSFDSDGITLNWSARASTRQIFILVLKGPSSFVGNYTLSTVLNTVQSVSGFGGSPLWVFGFLDRNAESASATPVTGLRSWCVGSFQSTSAKAAHEGSTTHNVATTTCNRGSRTDQWFFIAQPGADLGRVNVNSIDADGFSTKIDDPDTAAFVQFIALW